MWGGECIVHSWTIGEGYTAIAKRLSRWGVRSLSEESRRGIMSVLVCCHWQLCNVGTAKCRYKELYEKSFEIQKLLDIYKRGDVPEFNQEFPVDPFELGADLVEFASEGEELQSVELEDYKAASERIPLRKNNRYLVQEEAAMKASPSETVQLHSAEFARQRDAQLADLARLQRDEFQLGTRSEAIPIGSWQPANNQLALGWYGDDSNRNSPSPPSSTLAIRSGFQMTSLRPQRRGPQADSDSRMQGHEENKWHSASQWQGKSTDSQWQGRGDWSG